MIVECDHCNTKFNLPDEKLKPEGVKIRCTRCKEIFEVPGPKVADDDFAAGDNLSGFEGGNDSSVGKDGGEGDLGLGIDDSLDFNIGNDISEEGGEVDGTGFDLDSPDSAESSVGDDIGFDDSIGDSPSDDDLSLDDDLTDDGLGFDEGSDGLTGGDSPSDDDFSLDDDSTDGGLGFDEGSDDLTGGDSPSDDDFSLDDDLTDGGLDFDEGSDGLTGGNSPSDDDFSLDDDSTDGGLDFDEGSDNLSFDDDSEFDISSLDSNGDTTIGEDPSGLDFSSPLENGGGGDDTSFDFASAPAGGDDMGMGGGLGLDIGEVAFEDGGMETTEGFAHAKMKKSRRSPLVVALLIVLVIVLGAYFAFKTFGGGKLSIESITSLFAGNKNPLDGLTIDETKVSHYYTVNNKTGKILVVNGMVLNSSEVPKGRIKVKINLYDSQKNIIDDSEALCGNILKLDFLVNSSNAQIIKSLNKQNPANARVEPKKSIGFTLVIFNIPPNSDSFDVEIVGAENVG